MAFRTSRGQLQELRTIEANLICASQHIYDRVLETSEPVDEQTGLLLRAIAQARMMVKNQYADEDEIDMTWHCTDKHLLGALMQCGEIIDSIARSGKEVPSELTEAFHKTNEASARALAMLLKIDPKELEEQGCQKCIEDYLVNKNNGKNG